MGQENCDAAECVTCWGTWALLWLLRSLSKWVYSSARNAALLWTLLGMLLGKSANSSGPSRLCWQSTMNCREHCSAWGLLAKGPWVGLNSVCSQFTECVGCRASAQRRGYCFLIDLLRGENFHTRNIYVLAILKGFKMIFGASIRKLYSLKLSRFV